MDLAVDHHPSQEFFAQNTCLDADRAACGELMYDILRGITPITRDIALPLYVAVSTDCGCFVYGNTSAGTTGWPPPSWDTGIPTAELNKRHFRTKSFKRLRLESMLTESLEFHDGGEIAIAAISLHMMDTLQADERDAEDIAAFVARWRGVKTGVTIRERKDGSCKISLRTDPDDLNASSVCALLGGRRPRRRRRGHGGGGHPSHQAGPDGGHTDGTGPKGPITGGLMANGILIIDKPQDWTSMDVCAK